MSSAAAAKSGNTAKVAQTAPKSGPFSAFERMIAWRYLRARRRETFISVIAGFSFTGIMLGVATLIIVMAVMNGFRAELLTRILGINGHLIMQPMDRPLDDYADLIKRIDGISGIKFAIPVVEGQALVQGNIGAGSGALVRDSARKTSTSSSSFPAISARAR